MKITLLSIQSKKEPWFEEVTKLYCKKLNPFCEFEIVHLKSSKSERSEAQKKIQEESQNILKKINANDYVVLLDESGVSLSSEQFAKRLQQWQDTGSKKVVFVVGGAFGVSEELKKRAQTNLSLSKMVYNHLVAQAVCMEQIYRAFSINKGLPYHNS